MSDIKLKEIKPGMVIHCLTKEEAKALFEHLNEVGYTWDGGEELNNGNTKYEEYGGRTCYKIYENDTITYGYKEYFLRKGLKITKFSDLIEPELEPEEVIRLLSDMCHNNRCFEDCPIGKIRTNQSCNEFRRDNPEKVMKVLRQWKADHEKKEPEVKWHFHAEVHGNGFDSVKNCDTEEEAIQFIEEELKKAGKDAYGEYKRTCIVN